MSEVGLTNGAMDERELEAFVNNDRSTDGVISMTRAHSAEQEIVRGGEFRLNKAGTREKLMAAADQAKPLLRGWSITPLDDRLLVRYASFREGYVCECCSGVGHLKFECLTCKGAKSIVRKEGWKPEPCPDCVIVGSSGREPVSCGFAPCAGCKGSGLAPGVFAVPDEAQQDHSYGDVVSVGAGVEDLAPGDRVLFSKFAGIYIKGEMNCCLLRRGEVMGYMRKA